MSADISALGNLTPAEPLDLEHYKDNQEVAALPKKGTYTVQAPDSFSFAPAKSGYLSAQIDPKIVGPTNDGYLIRFAKVSAKPFKRGGVTVSQIGDYLRAAGHKGRVGGDVQEIADAVEATANRTYQVQVDWKAYHKDTAYSVEGMERFPSDGNGGYLPWIEHPTEKLKDAEGNLVLDPQGQPQPLRMRANLFISRFIAQAN